MYAKPKGLVFSYGKVLLGTAFTRARTFLGVRSGATDASFIWWTEPTAQVMPLVLFLFFSSFSSFLYLYSLIFLSLSLKTLQCYYPTLCIASVSRILHTRCNDTTETILRSKLKLSVVLSISNTERDTLPHIAQNIAERCQEYILYFIGVGAKTLNDKKSEWPKSRNSKLSKFKCRKAIITNVFKVLNKNLRKKFKSKANIRMLEITKGKITN